MPPRRPPAPGSDSSARSLSSCPRLALSACSGESPVTTDPNAPAGASTTARRRPRRRRRRRRSAAADGGHRRPTPSATAAARRSAPTSPSGQALSDPVHRAHLPGDPSPADMPWPAGNPVSADELRDRRRLRRGRCRGSLLGDHLDRTCSACDGPDEEHRRAPRSNSVFKALAGAGDRTRRARPQGWLFFKMDKGAGRTVAGFHQPAYVVSTTRPSR